MTDINKNSVGIVHTQTIRVVERERPLKLDCGKTLAPIDVAYETYGSLNDSGDNAILICHALSGNAHVAGWNSQNDKKPGWWDNMVGPGKGLDTKKYFIICSNFLGGCSGTTGPCSLNPATGRQYGLDFPIITIADMVRVQKLLLDKLGIKKLLAIVGGSIGGMQVLQWTILYPEFMKAALPIATTSHLGAQSIAFDAVGRNAILGDSNFNNGQYDNEKSPDRGLAIARMIGHITYLSERGMREKFGRQLRQGNSYSYDFNSEFSVETYLDYQGQRFVERFDANSYLYITKAADYFDLASGYSSLKEALAQATCRFMVMSFSSDWLFTPEQSRTMVDALIANHRDVSFCNIESPYGHDAFLLEPEALGSFISGFLDATYQPGLKRKNKNIKPKAGNRQNNLEQAHRVRVDYEVIESLIEPNSTVLDIGCGDGELLAKLTEDKNIKGEGIELDQELVLTCVERGLSIIQHNIEHGLENYANKSYDYVILSQTVQTIKNTENVFSELLRVGKKVIVSFPNFAHWRCRTQLFFTGKVPVTKQLPFNWHNSPNIHCLSLKDFDKFCRKLSVRVERKIPLIKTRISPVKLAPNLFAEQVIYITSKE
ncbi:MAG: homoserine O-acetyltransferase [Sedimentisphaerales bacterium]|nr:homoserine O-acetyltransferase [Sedimentisphaerales bacterium]